jgi:hypothetical protein
MLLPSEAATLSQPSSSTSGLTQNSGASCTNNYCLSMAEDCGNPVTSWALNIHEVAVGMLYQTLQLVLPFLFGWLRMEQVFSKRHFVF